MAPKKAKILPKKLAENLTGNSFINVGTIENLFRDTIIVKITIDYVPKFEGILHLEDRKQIGKIYEIYGAIRNYRAAARILESLNISDYPIDTKVFMTGDFLTPLIDYVPVGMKHNFLYTPQEEDSSARKRKKPPKYVPSSESDTSGPGCDYIPPGSDGRVYRAEGPFSKTGIFSIRGYPIVLGGLPPYHAKPNQIIKGRGSFVLPTLPQVGPYTQNIQPTPVFQNAAYHPVPIHNFQNDYNDIVSKMSQLNTSGYYQSVAAPNLQNQACIPPPNFMQYTHSNIQNPQASPGYAENNLNESFRNISIQEPAARAGGMHYQHYNPDMAAAGRTYNLPPVQYYDDTLKYYQGFPSTYNTAGSGVEASTSHAGYAMSYRPPYVYTVQQGQYNQPMYDCFNHGNQQQLLSNVQPPTNFGYWPQPQNYPDASGRGDRGRGLGHNFRGRGRGEFRGQRGGYSY